MGKKIIYKYLYGTYIGWKYKHWHYGGMFEGYFSVHWQEENDTGSKEESFKFKLGNYPNFRVPDFFHQLDFHRCFGWFTENVICDIKDINYKTLDVYIRIFTGMLNECKLNDELKVVIHTNLIKAIREFKMEKSLEDLPF
jgi:hypothetical protein|nr:MAG TPA: hypothetical protein [Crassvirales sp.]